MGNDHLNLCLPFISLFSFKGLIKVIVHSILQMVGTKNRIQPTSFSLHL